MINIYQIAKSLFSFTLIFFLFEFSHGATYCLSKNTSLIRARQNVMSILLDSEKVGINTANHCLVLRVQPHRQGLIEKYIRMNYQVLRSSTQTSTSVRRELCRFKLKTVTSANKLTKGVELGKRVDISDKSSQSSNTQMTDFIVMEGRAGSISVDDDSLEVICEKKPSYVEVVFSMSQGRSKVSSTVDFRPGAWINIGSVHNDLSNKINEISIRNGLKKEKTSGKSLKDYYLMVN